jgi:hypothetical protein
MIRSTLVLIALLFALPTSAQTVEPTLLLSASPLYPKPGETVFVSVESANTDLRDHIVTWKSGGTVLDEGEGLTTIKVSAPASGETLRISVTLSGSAETGSVIVAPASVDLMWEADSYAPGLYRGRKLASPGSTITLQALPHLFKGGSEIAANQLTYTWRKNGGIISSASGKGKSSLSFVFDTFSESETITVNVANADKTVVAEGKAEIVPVEPTVQLYFEHPLYGTLYHDAIEESVAIGDLEMSFAAISYHVHASGPTDPKFSYVWRVNTQDVEENAERPNVLTINAGPTGAQALIELSLTHKDNYLFDGRGGWTVSFGSFGATEAGVSAEEEPEF